MLICMCINHIFHERERERRRRRRKPWIKNLGIVLDLWLSTREMGDFEVWISLFLKFSYNYFKNLTLYVGFYIVAFIIASNLKNYGTKLHVTFSVTVNIIHLMCHLVSLSLVKICSTVMPPYAKVYIHIKYTTHMLTHFICSQIHNTPNSHA